MNMHVSPKGRSFLVGHEGVATKAYRCPAGIITIGSGLTAASGVIVPKLGMTITLEENDRLVDLALTRNYLPRVRKALGDSVAQNAVDGAASFDFNTGAILKASWVKSFLNGDNITARKALSAWNKGGGKVLKGLVRRRAEEADIILRGVYPAWVALTSITPTIESTDFATYVVSVTEIEREEIRAAFARFGFDVGTVKGLVARAAVVEFQRAHDLKPDGKIGRATLATLQREIDAKAKSGTAAATTTGGVGVTVGGEVANIGLDTSLSSDAMFWAGSGVAVLGLAYGGYLAWRYRDLIAARLNDKLPRLAAYLRSF
ncbi:glycoside hydrolase family protein [Shinella zoogloeoides]|uniref:Lysozyme n=1 Tax=Shinella zoogloeoides TaxID=352475 RepID=A0A6N8TB92_SHIZO|nr:peptidoglycan-binding protein [Shinella zoogloeoides]MXN99425.1 lysozyme [Shinella zoogloeoides]UEX82796.1 peptidoglycan-binding protein [Shinella zoogloeoides]